MTLKSRRGLAYFCVVWVVLEGITLDIMSSPFPFPLWHYFPALLLINYEVSSLTVPCPSAMMLQTWTQLTMDWIPWNHEQKRTPLLLSCVGYVFFQQQEYKAKMELKSKMVAVTIFHHVVQKHFELICGKSLQRFGDVCYWNLGMIGNSGHSSENWNSKRHMDRKGQPYEVSLGN